MSASANVDLRKLGSLKHLYHDDEDEDEDDEFHGSFTLDVESEDESNADSFSQDDESDSNSDDSDNDSDDPETEVNNSKQKGLLRKSIGNLLTSPVRVARRLSTSNQQSPGSLSRSPGSLKKNLLPPTSPGLLSGKRRSQGMKIPGSLNRSSGSLKNKNLVPPSSPGLLSPRRISKGLASMKDSIDRSLHREPKSREPKTLKEECDLPPNATKEEVMAVLLAREFDSLDM